MIVDTSKAFGLIYSLNLEFEAGPVIEPIIVQLTSSGKLTLCYQHVYTHTTDAFATVIDRDDLAIIKLCSELTTDHISRRFAKKPVKSSEFFHKHSDEKMIKELIRPYVEERMSRIMDLIKDKPIYRKGRTNPAQEYLQIQEGSVTAHFHVKKAAEGITYYPTFRYQGDKLKLLNQQVDIITTQPCRILMDDRIFSFEENLDGKKLVPFFTRYNIHIPKENEAQFFNRFMFNLIADHTVIPEGFIINNVKSSPLGVLKLEQSWNHEIMIHLYYDYSGERFAANDNQRVKVLLEKDVTELTFKRIQRNFEEESRLKSKMKMLGFERREGASYIPSIEQFGELQSRLSDFFEWIGERISLFESNGFILEQDHQLKNIFLGKIEVSLSVKERNDWFDIYAFVFFGDYKVPLLRLKKYILEGTRQFPLPDGKIAVLPEEWFVKFRDILSLSIKDDEDNLSLKKHHYALIDVLMEQQKTSSDFERVIELADKMKARIVFPEPENLKALLRPYQSEGYQWMMNLNANNFGGILADDMGLGKTLQTLALLQSVKTDVIIDPSEKIADAIDNELISSIVLTRRSLPSLIIMPTSLIHNWEAEIKKFASDSRVMVYAGLYREMKVRHFHSFDIILTTYGTVRNDIEILKKIEFNYIVLDESQVIKNPSARITQSVKHLKSRHKLSLTGTPIENSLSDLWSQLNFLNPGILGSYEFFRDEFSIPIEKRNDAQRMELLRQMIRPFILRRTKEEVASDLPILTEEIYYSEMTEEQKKYYEETKNYYRNKILQEIEEFGEKKSQLYILSGLMQLRQIANHPRLTNPDFEGESGKYKDVLETMQGIIQRGHKILIFSQFVRHLELFKEHFERTGTSFAYLIGKTIKRKEEIEEFRTNEKTQVFLISLKAGGTGLNLIESDYVFLLDPWWNPMIEDQAISRAHRIGQENPVFAYRFISKGTVEEKIRLLQERKLKLFHDFIDGEPMGETSLTVDDVNMLFA